MNKAAETSRDVAVSRLDTVLGDYFRKKERAAHLRHALEILDEGGDRARAKVDLEVGHNALVAVGISTSVARGHIQDAYDGAVAELERYDEVMARLGEVADDFLSGIDE